MHTTDFEIDRRFAVIYFPSENVLHDTPDTCNRIEKKRIFRLAVTVK